MFRLDRKTNVCVYSERDRMCAWLGEVGGGILIVCFVSSLLVCETAEECEPEREPLVVLLLLVFSTRPVRCLCVYTSVLGTKAFQKLLRPGRRGP